MQALRYLKHTLQLCIEILSVSVSWKSVCASPMDSQWWNPLYENKVAMHPTQKPYIIDNTYQSVIKNVYILKKQKQNYQQS